MELDWNGTQQQLLLTARMLEVPESKHRSNLVRNRLEQFGNEKSFSFFSWFIGSSGSHKKGLLGKWNFALFSTKLNVNLVVPTQDH